jgi:hypothetical protein
MAEGILPADLAALLQSELSRVPLPPPGRRSGVASIADLMTADLAGPPPPPMLPTLGGSGPPPVNIGEFLEANAAAQSPAMPPIDWRSHIAPNGRQVVGPPVQTGAMTEVPPMPSWANPLNVAREALNPLGIPAPPPMTVQSPVRTLTGRERNLTLPTTIDFTHAPADDTRMLLAPFTAGPMMRGAGMVTDAVGDVARTVGASPAGQFVGRQAASLAEFLQQPHVGGPIAATAITAATPIVAEPPGSQAPSVPAQPAIAQRVLDAVFGTGNRISHWLDGNAQFAPTDREEFFRQRRTQRQSLEEAQRQAEERVRQSQEYRNLVDDNMLKAADRLIQNARRSATERVQQSEAGRPTEEGRIQREYDQHIAEMNRLRSEFYNKSWTERGGGVATLINAASYVVPFLLARRGFNKIADEGNDLIEAARRARQAGNAADEARALISLDTWGNRALGRQAWVALKAAAIPAEIRAGGNVWDAYFLPEGTGAQTRAHQRLTHAFTSPSAFLQEYGPHILGGVATAAGARLTSQNLPRDVAAGEIATLRGTGYRPPALLDRVRGRGTPANSPEEIGRIIEGRRAATPSNPTPPPPNPQPPNPNPPPQTPIAPPSAGGPPHEPGVTRYRNPRTGEEIYLDAHGRWRGPNRSGGTSWSSEPPSSWERISQRGRGASMAEFLMG